MTDVICWLKPKPKPKLILYDLHCHIPSIFQIYRLYSKITSVISILIILFMKTLTSFILILLLVWHSATVPTSTGEIGVGIASPTTTTAFSCLIDQGNSVAIIRIYKANETYWGVDPDGFQNLINADAAHSHPGSIFNVGNFKTMAYMEVCRNNDGPSQVTAVDDAIFPRLYTQVFVKVQPSPNPECLWEIYTQQQNCDFLTSVLNAFQSSISFDTIGVFSTANIWASFFGHTCDHIGLTYPLWYADYDIHGQVNPAANFNDFVSFGGWDAPSLKQTQGNTTATSLCGNAWHVYLDRIWRPSPPV